MESTASFGYWLRRRRKALDLTQAALAQQVGCAVVTIRKIEADELRPSRQVAEILAGCLAIPAEERAAFLKAARAELAVDRLALPSQPIPSADEGGVDAPSVIFQVQNLPSGTVTFLLTDIEDSTQRWEQHPHEMEVALARHDGILHAAIESSDGYVFKTVGDAVYTAFASAPMALAAALAAQRVLLAEDWGMLGTLPVCMALHTGTAQARGGDYVEPSLNRAARLAAAAHGGQILLSRATQELVRDDLPQDVKLRDLGEHRLKDLIRPEHIFQVVAAGLPTDFPPLHSLDRRRHNLPSQATALIGREREVAQVSALLRRAEVRLVTLTGPGGTGKTRLALQVAAEVLDDFADGAWLVALAPISDPALVAVSIAQMLGVREAVDQQLAERLQDELHDRQMLLMLDNFEQVLAAAPLIAELLVAASGLKVLVTSRAALHLSGEHELMVPPLALPDLRHMPPLESLSQYAAVELFIERSLAVKPDFAVTNASAPAVAEICVRLDGLPLAIELAAARSKLFAPQTLLTRLGSRLTLLTGGARDLPARQQTLRNTIDWSYNLLEEAEQHLFARLGVFVDGCTLEAVEAICRDCRLEEPDQSTVYNLQSAILEGVATLIDQSLLRQVEQADGEPRLVMLETLREYALEQLEQRRELGTILRQHASYYLALAEAAEPELVGAAQATWLDRLEMEHNNLRAALAWSQTGNQEMDVGLRLVAALWRFWEIHGHVAEGRSWAERVLARNSMVSAARAKALTAAGSMAWLQGDYSQAIVFHEQALVLYRELADVRGVAFALNNIGVQFYRLGDYARAEALFQKSLATARGAGDEQHIAMVLNNRGLVARAQGDYGRAITLYRESLALWRKQGNKRTVAIALNNLGIATRDQGDYTQAVALFEASIRLGRELGYKWNIAINLEELAAVAGAKQQPERAARLFGAAEGLRETIGAPLSPVDRAEYEANVVAVRAQLSEQALAASWAAGRAMPLEQVLAYVLGEDT